MVSFHYGQFTPWGHYLVADKVAGMFASILRARPLAPTPDTYNYDYSYESTMDPADAMGVIMLMLGLYFLFFAIALVINGFVWAGAFAKAGYAKWKAYVPFYNTWIMVKMVGRPESHFWFLFIPYFNIYMMIVIMNDMSKSFGKETGFTVGLIFLPVVFAAILSYGDAQYRGPSYMSPQQKQYANQYGQQYAPAQGQPQYAQAPNTQYGAQYGQQDPNAQYSQQYGQPQGPAQPQYGQDPNQNPYGSGPTQ